MDLEVPPKQIDRLAPAPLAFADPALHEYDPGPRRGELLGIRERLVGRVEAPLSRFGGRELEPGLPVAFIELRGPAPGLGQDVDATQLLGHSGQRARVVRVVRVRRHGRAQRDQRFFGATETEQGGALEPQEPRIVRSQAQAPVG